MKALPWRLLGKADSRADHPALTTHADSPPDPSAVPGRDTRADGRAPTTRADSPPDPHAMPERDMHAETHGDASGGDVAPQPRPLAALAARVVAAEPVLAPGCALVLLLAPNPLVWPAALIGGLPSAARLLTTGRPWRATAFDLPFVLLAIGALLGSYASLNRDGASIRMTGLLAAVVLYAALREHASGERALRRLVLGALVGAVLGTLLLLVLVGPFLLLERVPPLVALVATVDPWGYRHWFVDQDWLLQRYRFRASGVGALADVGLALAFAALVGLRGRLPRLIAALSIALFLLALVVADNRGSMLAGSLTLGLMATVWRRRLLALVPVVAVLALLIVAFGPSDRGLNLRTLAQRFWFWEHSVYLAREVPLTEAGLGLESVQLVYRGYFLPAYPPFSHAHNIYLQGLLEYGVFGLLGLLGLGLATLWVGWRATPSPERWKRVAQLAGFGVALAMLTTGLSEIVLHTTLGGVLAAVGLGLLAATGVGARSEGRGTRDGSAGAASDAPTATNPVGASLAAPVRGQWLVAGAGLLVVTVLAVSGLGASVGARLLLNAGTADLNRATFSETIGRQERSTALNRATELLHLAGALAPGDAAIQRNLALALAANDEARQARAAADRAKALIAATDGGPDRADLLQLGRAYVATSTWGEAVRAWQAAEAAPQLIQLGNRLLRNRNFEQASTTFIATARVDPQSRGAYDGFSRAARERKLSADEMVAELGPLLERGSPTELGARLQAARIFRDAGQLRDGAQHLRRAEEISAPPELSFEYGRMWLAAGRPDRAVPLLIRPAADLPYDAESWFWLARAHAELGQPAEAVATIRQGLSRLDPSGEFAPPAERLPETAAVRAVEIRRSERAPLLGVLGESLVRLGRADEALPVLDEAVAALPKEAWLASARAHAFAVQSGAPPNLLANSTFDRDGSWSVRPPIRVDHVPWTDDMFVNEAPTIADGVVRFAPRTPDDRMLGQDVFYLSPQRQYRLTVRVRAEGLGDGAVMAFITTSDTMKTTTSPADARWTARTDAADWTTLTIETEAGSEPAGILTVGLGFVPGTRPGAVLWCDEATLIDMADAR